MEIFGYDFKNNALLREALTTPAYRMDVPEAKDNQRLEFLGDAVLGLLSAECLFAEYPDEQEGSLTVRRTHLVSSESLCEAACRLGLAARLKRNRSAVDLPHNSKTLADAIEAVIGAAYLDGGFAAARKVYDTLALTEKSVATAWDGNPKGELQMRAQAMTPPQHPAYELVKREGKPHEPVFTVRVTVEGMGSAEGTAHTRKHADACAAAALLSRVTAHGPQGQACRLKRV